jgi:hypothetical protein
MHSLSQWMGSDTAQKAGRWLRRWFVSSDHEAPLQRPLPRATQAGKWPDQVGLPFGRPPRDGAAQTSRQREVGDA